jgi:hemolysin III
MRGFLPLVAFFATLPITAWLVAHSASRVVAIALLYGAGLLALFGVSALYHRRDWSPEAYEWMRKVDHLTIFVFIAASYTPIGLFGVGGVRGVWLVRGCWTFVVLGALQIFFWPRAPRGLRSALYIAMGWTGVFAIAPLAQHLGWFPPAMLVGGGLLYTLGAVIYTRRRPDPVPNVFGYHEVFHALVVVACGMLFVCIHACLAVG